MNTGTPMSEKPSAMVVKVTVLPVPVAPATSPWRLPNFGCRKTLPWLAGSDVGVVTDLPTRLGYIALPRLEMPGILANERGSRSPAHDATPRVPSRPIGLAPGRERVGQYGQ